MGQALHSRRIEAASYAMRGGCQSGYGFAFRWGKAVDGTWEFSRNSGRMILTRPLFLAQYTDLHRRSAHDDRAENWSTRP